MILYLHGFRSSPQSLKATLMARAMRERGMAHDWFCPQLPASPKEALALAHRSIEQAQAEAGWQADRDLTIIGSSLGGYYATCLAEHWGCRAALLNPVVHAARDLATQVGSHTQFYSGQPFNFLPEYIDELADMAVNKPRHPERYFLLAATGDELLDWREMADWFAGCRQQIIEGSDHGISDFAHWLPQVMEFALVRA
ncbi:MAG TPA: YqiA/YcfP family alpha/beta fold hydrolase [Paralcaligenes sp.]|jgi:predicted esterase YcpF (UPF0227 family)